MNITLILTTRNDAESRIYSGDYSVVADEIVTFRGSSPFSIATFMDFPGKYFISSVDLSSAHVGDRAEFTAGDTEYLLSIPRPQVDAAEDKVSKVTFGQLVADNPVPSTPRRRVKFSKPVVDMDKVRQSRVDKEIVKPIITRNEAVCTKKLMPTTSCSSAPIGISFYIRLDSPNRIFVDLVCESCYSYLRSRSNIVILASMFIRGDEEPASTRDVRSWLNKHENQAKDDIAADLPTIIDNIFTSLRKKLDTVQMSRIKVGGINDFVESLRNSIKDLKRRNSE